MEYQLQVPGHLRFLIGYNLSRKDYQLVEEGLSGDAPNPENVDVSEKG